MRRAVILLAIFFQACSSPNSTNSDVVFRYNESAGITSLDPAFARNQANIWATNQLFNGLVQMDENLAVQPCVASSWAIKNGGRSYVFQLRKDVLFHKNKCFENQQDRAVTAHDFVYSFERLKSAKLAAPGSWVFQKASKFIAHSDTVLEIKLKEAYPPFLGILSMKYCSVVSEKAIKFYQSNFRNNPVGTGPFYFKLWVENEKLVLRKNPDYFELDSAGKQLPYLKAVAISFIPDKQSAFLEFVKGKLDFMSGLDASYKDEMLTFNGDLQPKYTDKFNLYRQPYLNTEYLAFMMDSTAFAEYNPVQKKKVRQAINYGFDRVKMMRFLRNNIGVPATAGMIPMGMQGFDSTQIKGYHYNPDKAKELLRSAGYFMEANQPEIILQTNASYLDLCEYLQGELASLGLKIKVEVSPPSTLRQAMATSKVQFFRASWIGDYPDAENYLSLFYSKNWAPNGPNYTHFKNARFDSLYERANQTDSLAQRLALYQQMDNLVMEEAPVVPLYYDQVLRFYPKKVKGLGGNAMNLLDLKRVQKTND